MKTRRNTVRRCWYNSTNIVALYRQTHLNLQEVGTPLHFVDTLPIVYIKLMPWVITIELQQQFSSLLASAAVQLITSAVQLINVLMYKQHTRTSHKILQWSYMSGQYSPMGGLPNKDGCFYLIRMPIRKYTDLVVCTVIELHASTAVWCQSITQCARTLQRQSFCDLVN